MILVGTSGIRTSHPLLREVTMATIPANLSASCNRPLHPNGS
jgi:hypothetical protein